MATFTVTAGWLQAGALGAFGSANITIAGGSSANGVNGPAQFNATLAYTNAGDFNNPKMQTALYY